MNAILLLSAIYVMDSTCTINTCGTREWLLNDQIHRVDGPAIEYQNGTKEWWLNGRRHRVDSPAIEYTNGSNEWWVNGQLHRTDGPAIEWIGIIKSWYLNGRHHRIDGPAAEYENGNKVWYLGGIKCTENDINALQAIIRFRSRVHLFTKILGFNLSRLLDLSKTRAINEWYYHPDRGGGKLLKARAMAKLQTM